MFSNKISAITFLQLAASGKVDEAFANHVSDDFIHHNAYFKGDRNSLMDAMKQASIAQPNKTFTVKRAVSEGDVVVVHSHVVVKRPGEMEMAVVHILRFNDENRVVEMWDLGQMIQKDSPNQYGMF